MAFQNKAEKRAQKSEDRYMHMPLRCAQDIYCYPTCFVVTDTFGRYSTMSDP